MKTDDASLCDNEPRGRTPSTGDISSGGNMDDNDEVLSLGLELIDPKKWRKTNTLSSHDEHQSSGPRPVKLCSPVQDQ